MSDPYEKVKGGRLTFKGGVVASRSKTINKKNKRKHKNKINSSEDASEFLSEDAAAAGAGGGEEEGSAAGGGDMYTIDAAKRKKYEELFPVEAKKFGYDPKFNSRTVEDALDDRVKKKADRYCK
uniref:Uncharacterized protein n=1 Tax=Davidia involucrata TaxID=16924 RepID=A0A5B7BKU0_DAVIN